MRGDGDILVVGTTADYVEWIDHRHSADVIFLTAPGERERAEGRYATPRCEILTDLSNPRECLRRLRCHIHSGGRGLAGIACFDDTSLALAAILAEEMGVDFPPARAIHKCLDKHLAKLAWRSIGVPCPIAIAISHDPSEHTWDDIEFPCVLKPHVGTGSEHVFLCHTQEQASAAAREIIESARNAASTSSAVAEKHIVGLEFSCDYLVDHGDIQILRTARKHMAPSGPFGTAMAYTMPSQLPPRIRDHLLPDVLLLATQKLGITRSLCMADFIVCGDEFFLLEISPRIGGDCLPHILRDAWGIDALSSAIQFARGGRIDPWLGESAPQVVGLRVFADTPGTITAIDTSEVGRDGRVISCDLNCLGRTVVLPPEDYSSWLLGYVIFQPTDTRSIDEQITEIRQRIQIETEGEET